MDQPLSLPPPAHLALRHETRAEHAAAEQAPVMRALLDGALDAGGYRRLLQGQLALHRAWETRHGAWLDGPLATAGWRYQRRTARLECDLAGWDPAAPEPAGQADEAPSPVLGTHAASWGELYVIEGSALGGRLLARTLERLFPDHPHHFFRLGQEPANGPWRTFQSMLDRHLPDTASQAIAIAAARTMFHRAQRMLEAVHP